MKLAARVLARAIDDLKDRCKVDVSALLPEELADLVHACDRVANPFADINADAAGFPVRVCKGVYLWRLTAGAAIWMSDFAERWWGGDYAKYRAAAVYVAMNARNPDAFLVEDEREAGKAIRRALRRIPATDAEIQLALDRVLGLASDAPAAEESTAANWAAMIARVEAQTGLPRSHWLWGVSYSQMLAVYNQCERIVSASGGKTAPRLQDELDRATNELQRLKVRIMRRING